MEALALTFARPRLVRFACLTLLLGSVAHARLDSPLTERAETFGRAAVARATSPRAAADLIRLHALRDEVDDLNLLAGPYAAVLNKRGVDPFARVTAQLFYAEVMRARGLLTKSAQLLEPLGFVQKFYVVGGFDNEGKEGCDIDAGPEGAPIDLKTSYPTKGREAKWQKLPVASADGYVDLAAAVRPNSEAVAYALTFLEASKETRATLSLGTSGAFRLFVNGQLAAKEDRYNLPRPDQARVAVRLRKGLNRVLVKVCQEAGPLGFFLRSERGPGGSATPRAVLPETIPPLEKGPSPAPVRLPTLASTLQAMSQSHPKDAELRADLALVLSSTHAFEEREHEDTAAAARAAEERPADVELQLLAAQLQREDKNLRRRYLQRAVDRAPTSAEALLRLAQHEVSIDHPERALPLLEGLVKKHPKLGAARLLQAQAVEALGDWPQATRLVDATLRELPHLPRVMREAARHSRRLDRVTEAVSRTRTALALRFDDNNSRRALASLLADLAQVEEAQRQYQQLLAIDPFDNGARLSLAELLASNGALDQAEGLFAEAKALAPDEPEVHEREGRALLHAGQRDRALTAFQRALVLRPQNPALKEALRSLQGGDAAVGAAHAIDPRPLVKEADSYAGEDAVYLVDYTFTRVQPSGLSSRFHQLAVKVYSQRGVDGLRSYPITYSPDRQEVRVLRARLTKPDGSVVESYAEQDRAMNEPWTGMYYDTRAKVLAFPSLGVGDVLELQYRLDDTAQDNLLSDYWGDVDYLQATSPKLRYQYFVDMPAARKLYWNRQRLPPGILAAQDPERDGRILYRFSASRVPKIIPEPSMPGWAEVVTTLHVSTYQTWDQVGRYYWGLVRDQLRPNEELRKTVDAVLKGVDRKDQLAVVRAVFNFVVSHTRYVALEFGIHGYKPYRVDRVLARRFGDCKDKASLIHAMLKVAGVDSRLVLLRMRHLGEIGSEPASLAAFNHAIAYVPKFQLYLDGTAEFHGSGEMPSSDRVANVLIVEPEGSSTFRTTPEAKAEDNATELLIDIALAADGSAQLVGQTVVKGQGAPEYRRSYQAPATRQATFEQAFAQTYPGLSVKSVGLSDPTKLDENVKLTFEMRVPRYAEALSSGVRFHPFGSGRSYTQAFAPLSERKFDLVMAGPWQNTLRSRYTLPTGHALPELPAEMKEETPFGRFRITHRVEDGKLVSEAEVALTVARVKAAEYPAFRAFLGRVDQAFGRKLLAPSAAGAGSSTATR